MAIKPPFTDVDIKTVEGGFYHGNSLPIALISKLVMALLVIWALIWPGNANAILSSTNYALLEGFNTF